MKGQILKRSLIVLLLIFLSLIFNSCKNWVTDVDPLVDAISDSRLNSEDQLPFLINGVETKFASAVDRANILAAGLSDALLFDPGFNPEFGDIDEGNIQLDNTYTSGTYSKIGELRFYADDLVRRTKLISKSDTTLGDSSLFIGYFYGGYARYLYAAYFGLTQTQGGSPINGGVFINSDDMYDSAITKFKQSLKYTSDGLILRTVNSVIARAYLYKGDFSNSANYAENGLVKGDHAFQALHNTTFGTDNFWYETASKTSPVFVADLRFKQYINIDHNDTNRIKLDSIVVDSNQTYYCQSVYSTPGTPQTIITWEENNLMRAELAIRGYGSGNAKDLVNEVREEYGIADINSVNLDSIYVERDKQLFPSGNRLVDERRFHKWHLPAGTWEYLPIPVTERDSNPNLN